MKHKIFAIIGAGLLLLSVGSCREENDVLSNFSYEDHLVFAAADTSYAAKFDLIWKSLNQYYAIWDLEAEYGLDWDAVYDEYYPQFVALDQRAKNDTVKDEELKTLLGKVLNPLHDGHFSMDVKNHMTGNHVTFQPSTVRVASRDDWDISKSFSPVLDYYANVANGEVETDSDGNPIVMEHSTNPSILVTQFKNTPGMGLMWALEKIQELEALPEPTEMQAFQLQQLKNMVEEIGMISGKPVPTGISIFNDVAEKYSFLNVPGFDYIDPGFAQNSLAIKFALLKGNIAYFHINAFELTPYMNANDCKELFNMDNPVTQQLVAKVKQVWQSWFDAVQTLHQQGTLGGVIIDLRSNGGGQMDDSKYVVGSLVPDDYICFGYQRFKRGYGRFDYSPLMPARVPCLDEPHETITEPVVVMINSLSVSMAESSALCARTLPNGKVIGKRSYGAICDLTNNSYSSFNYSGFIGVENKTCIFGYLPSMASFTLDKKLIEGVGVTPDIEVDLDTKLFETTGRDTQLDRALQYIRTGQ